MNAINPFPGLRPFQAHEAHLFFGRERYIDTIIEKLNLHHFVSIVGNSGSGKSSLLRAGVIPKLIKSNDWIVLTMRPGKHPVEELYHVLNSNSALQLNTNAEQQLTILQNNELGLVQIVRNSLPSGKRLLLVVDQFEELFRFQKTQEDIAIQFVNLLLKAIGQRDIPIHIIITLRSDFIGDCEQFIGLPEAINNGQFLIPRMKKDELQLSITGPVEYVGNRISPRLVQQLLNAVGTNPDQLPVLQHVLMRTWEVWKNANDIDGQIDLVHYEATGGIEKALSNHAEEAMDEINTEDKKQITAILFKTLTLKEADNRGVRRPTSVQKIAEIANTSVENLIPIINVFRKEDKGFLTPSFPTSINEKTMIDISHESLMRVWERLSNWVEEEYDSAQIYQRITASALLYEKGLSGLWRDPDLQIAIDWNAKYNVNQKWTEQYNGFFELSKRFIDASHQQKMFLLADQRRKRKLTNMLTIAVLITLSALSIWAFTERNKSGKNEELAVNEKKKAQQQEILAQEQKLVAEANASKAEKEKKNAEVQKQLAIKNESEAKLQKQNAEQSSLLANKARKLAEMEKQTAIEERTKADSLRKVAILSEKNAYRLSILSIAQALAIKSTALKVGSNEDEVKKLLALQAYKFNREYQGKTTDVDIYTALYSAYKESRTEDDFQNASHIDMVRSVAFNPKTNELASVGSDGLLLIHDGVKINKILKQYPRQNAILDNIAYNALGDKIACLADGVSVIIFNSNNQNEGVKMPIIHTDKLTGIAWGGEHIITISNDNTLKITHSITQKLQASIPLTAKPTCLVISADKRFAFVGHENGLVSKVNLESNSISTIVQLKEKITAIDCALEKLALGTYSGKIELIDLKTNQSVIGGNLNRHISTVTSLAFSENGKNLISGSLDGIVYKWQFSQKEAIAIPFKDHSSWVWSVAFNKKEDRFCSGGKDKKVILYVNKEEDLVEEIMQTCKRNLTLSEWIQYIGEDIPYQKTIAKF